MNSNNITQVCIALFAIISSCSNNKDIDSTIDDIDPVIDVSVRSVNFDNPYSEQSFEIYINSDVEWDIEYNKNSWFDVEFRPYIDQYNLIVHSSINTLGIRRRDDIFIYPSGNKKSPIKITINQQRHQAPNLLDSISDQRFRDVLVSKYFKSEYATELDVSQIRYIDCKWEHIRSLKGIEYFKELRRLDCSENFLSPTIDLSENTKIHELNTSSNSLKFINLSNNIELKKIDCSHNYLTNIELSKNEKLEILYCYSNNISNLDITRNNQLAIVDCSQNPILKNSVLISKKVYDKARLIPRKENEIYKILISQ